MHRNFWAISAGIGLVLALTIFRDFTTQIRNQLIGPAPAYGQSGGGDLPRTAPEGCKKCQESLDTYWKLKDKADGLPVIPPYLQDEIDAARQTYLDCVEDCGPGPTPEPTATPTCEELYGNSVITAYAYPQELGSGCVVKLSAFVDTLPNKYIVKWSGGGEGDTIERTVTGNGEQSTSADLYVFCHGDYWKVKSASCSYTVHDPPYSISSPNYSGPAIAGSAEAALKCECPDPLPDGSPNECPLTVTLDREVCRKIRLELQGGGEIGAPVMAALKGSIGWDWERDICISSHVGGTVNVPCGWKYTVRVILYEEKAKGEIHFFPCGKSPAASVYSAYNYSVEVSASWDSLREI